MLKHLALVAVAALVVAPSFVHAGTSECEATLGTDGSLTVPCARYGDTEYEGKFVQIADPNNSDAYTLQLQRYSIKPTTEAEVLVVTRMTAKDGMEVRAMGELMAFVGRTRMEAGAVGYDAYMKVDIYDTGMTPNKFILYEQWRDWDAITEHMASDHFNSFITRSAELFDLQSQESVFYVMTCEDLGQIDALPSPSTVATFMTAQDGMLDEAYANLIALTAVTGQEDGSLQYDLYQSVDDRFDFLLDEVWESPNSVYAHFGTHQFAAFDAVKDDLFVPNDTANSPFHVTTCTPLAEN